MGPSWAKVLCVLGPRHAFTFTKFLWGSSPLIPALLPFPTPPPPSLPPSSLFPSLSLGFWWVLAEDSALSLSKITGGSWSATRWASFQTFWQHLMEYKFVLVRAYDTLVRQILPGAHKPPKQPGPGFDTSIPQCLRKVTGLHLDHRSPPNETLS